MNRKSILSLAVAAILMGTSPLSLADRDEDTHRSSTTTRDVAPVENQAYLDECGACHFAYQPGLLPERSWRKIMGSLEDHFGENAELPAADVTMLTDYLATHAGDHSDFRRARKLMRSIPAGETPLRITKIPYFVREHREVAARIKGGDKVRSLSNCQACHRDAARGSYEEDEVNIPGVGRWED